MQQMGLRNNGLIKKEQIRVKGKFAMGTMALLATALIRRWMGTLHYRCHYEDPTVDPVHANYRGAKIFVFWHENILFPLHIRGRSCTSMLLSRHWDADILDRVAGMMGFGTVRGSSFNGGTVALRELTLHAKHSNLAITPDGPRGPRRQLAPGCIYLAGTLGIPIVAMGCGYDRPWRMKTWDQFAIPRPGSRARAIVSRAIAIPPNLDRKGVEWHRQGLERLLSKLSEDAEAWARSGAHVVGEQPLRREPSRDASRNILLEPRKAVELDDELSRLQCNAA